MLTRIRQWRDELFEAIDRAERESLMDQVAHPEGRLHYQIVGVTVLACVVLTVLEFYGSSSDWGLLKTIAGFFSDTAPGELDALFRGRYGELCRLGYWASATFLCYMLIPMLYVALFMRESLVEMGLSFRGTLEHVPLYVALYLLILPAVYLVSGTASFQHTYPFYGRAGRSLFDFLVWELCYALQFLSLEFFFRGFLIHGLKSRFGFYAIFVSVIPYCMIHFGKPFPEAIGAILAGITLGAFSLFTGNIWLGVLIHVSVAVSMDVFAMFDVFTVVNDTLSRWMLYYF